MSIMELLAAHLGLLRTMVLEPATRRVVQEQALVILFA